MLREKNVILGVSGSIAAYKAVYLARLCSDAGADVWPILTKAATRFVGPLTFTTLTQHRAIVDMWSASEGGEISHVELADRADALLIAPATADLLARLAMGRADDPLTAVALSTDAPWVVAPAMETGMWENPATQANVATLTERGARFVMPASGELASGRHGVGRMAEPHDIIETLHHALTPHDLEGQRVLVTAGPTREHFDPVRFVTNASSGKMGFAVARVARRRGANVKLITGPTSLAEPPGVDIERVETTEELLNACKRHLPDTTLLVMAAAPADFAPSNRSSDKEKKPSGDFQADMTPTTDILTTLSPRSAKCVVVGFAAETGNPTEKAKRKLEAKNLDIIVANDVTLPGAGFGTDTNVVEIFEREGIHEKLGKMSKEAVANEILNRVAALITGRS